MIVFNILNNIFNLSGLFLFDHSKFKKITFFPCLIGTIILR